MNCPICKKPMKWQEGLLDDAGGRDLTVGRYYCTPCRINKEMQDSGGIREGRKKAKEFEGVAWDDRRILSLPTAVQIGILRERQKDIR